LDTAEAILSTIAVQVYKRSFDDLLLWSGLIEPEGWSAPCVGAACDGVINWVEGQSFSFDSSLVTEVYKLFL